MRELVIHLDSKAYRGTWDTWEDSAFGRMVEVTRDAWLIRAPVDDQDPVRVAERCLIWCVSESFADHRR